MKYVCTLLICLSLYAASVEEAILKTQQDIKDTQEKLNNQSKTITQERLQLQKQLVTARENIAKTKAAKGALDLERLKAKDAHAKQVAELEYLEKTLAFLDTTVLEFRRSFETRLSNEERQVLTDDFQTIDSEFSKQDTNKALDLLLKLAHSHNENQVGGQHYPATVIDSSNKKLTGECVQLGPIQYFSGQGNQGIIIVEKNMSESRLYDNFEELEKQGIKNLVENGQGIIPVDSTRGTAIKLRDVDESLIDKLKKGGLTMYPLIALALFCLIIAVYKLISINMYKIRNAEKQIQDILKLLQEDKEDDALAACEKMGLPLGPVIRVGIKHRNASQEHIEELMYERVLMMLPRLEKLLTPLAVGASAAPLLGLLGTVTGMIHTFSMIQVYGTGNASVLSSGIAEALVTTLVGLVIAVPTLLMHAYLSGKVKKAVSTTQQSAIMFVNGLAIQRQKKD